MTDSARYLLLQLSREPGCTAGAHDSLAPAVLELERAGLAAVVHWRPEALLRLTERGLILAAAMSGLLLSEAIT